MAIRRDFTDLMEWDGTNRPWRNRKILAHLHIAHRLEYDEMSEVLSCAKHTVGKWVRRLNVRSPWRVKEVLDTMYHVHGHSSITMAERWGVSKTVVLKHMRKHGIERNGIGERVDYPELHDEEWLQEKYINEHLSTHRIADILDCNKKAVVIALKRNGISVRESVADYSGSLNPKYSGGGSMVRSVRHALSGRQAEWREHAKQICEESGECYSCEKKDTILHAHHIIPVACGGVNEDELLIPLCPSCHTKADKHIREYTTRHVVEPLLS